MTSYISQNVIEEVVRRLVEGLQPERIFLFGSYAYGQPTKASDLDIMVIVSESNEPPHRRDQKAYGFLHGIKVPVDLLVLTQGEFVKRSSVVTSLARRVMEKGKVLYERGKARGDSELNHGEHGRNGKARNSSSLFSIPSVPSVIQSHGANQNSSPLCQTEN